MITVPLGVLRRGPITVRVDLGETSFEDKEQGKLKIVVTIDEEPMHSFETKRHVDHDVTFGKGGPGGRCSTCHEDLTAAQGLAVLVEDLRSERKKR